jgi:hypothetical protein
VDISGSGIPIVTIFRDWYDPRGRHVAGAFFQNTQSPTLSITCVPTDTADASSANALDASVYLPPELRGGTTYDVPWRDPKCQAWAWLY